LIIKPETLHATRVSEYFTLQQSTFSAGGARNPSAALIFRILIVSKRCRQNLQRSHLQQAFRVGQENRACRKLWEGRTMDSADPSFRLY
jgi:hypothetical protein